MLAGAAAVLAMGANAQTLETVWDYNAGSTTIPGAAAGGDLRFASVKDSKLIVTDKGKKQILYWDAENQGAVLHDLNEFWSANFSSESVDAETGETTTTVAAGGTAITTDDAGNIIINSNFPSAPSGSEWVIIPADGSDWKKISLDWTAIGMTEAARVDQVGRTVGNVLSDEGGYMWLVPNGGTQVAIFKIVNGEQDADYSAASTAPGFALSTSCTPQPLYLTVAEIDALMDENGDNSASFWMRNRSTSQNVYKWNDEGSAMEAITIAGTSEEGYTTKNASSEGFETFSLQGVQYFVVPMTTDGTTANRSNVFGIYDGEGNLAACYSDYIKTGIGQGMGSFYVEPIDDNSVYIYRWLAGTQAAKFKFSVPQGSGVEGVAAVAEEVPAVYYNLQGVQVNNPANGLYIVKRGDKATKELIVK